jgi:hypothetical protein
MAESSADLQNQLNSFQDYCSIWKLCYMEKILTYNHYKKYKILYHYTYLQLYYTYYHSCYLRVTCTKDHLSKLCWKLKVNTDKSKVMVFSRGKLPRNLNFSLNGEKLEIVNSLNYLGIELSS